MILAQVEIDARFGQHRRMPEMPFRFRRIQLLRQQRNFAGNAMAFGFVTAEMQRFRAASTAFGILAFYCC